MKIKAKMKKDMAIKELVGKHGDKVVFHADFGRSVSKNPYVSFSFAGAQKGDAISMTWTDNTDETVTVESVIK